MNGQRPVSIVYWRGYHLDINAVQAVTPISALCFRVCLQGGASLNMEYASVSKAETSRDAFVNLWTTTTTEAEYNRQLLQA